VGRGGGRRQRFLINTSLGLGIYVFTGSNLATDIATGSLVARWWKRPSRGWPCWASSWSFAAIRFRAGWNNLRGVAALGFAAPRTPLHLHVRFSTGRLGGLLA